MFKFLKVTLVVLVFFSFVLFLNSCGSKDSSGNGGDRKIVKANDGKKIHKTSDMNVSGPVSVKRYDVPVGADPNISAEDGGEGFSGDGWETNDEFTNFADPKAKKGGRFLMSFSEYPPTFRTEGKDSAREVISFMGEHIYETLLDMDYKTQNYVPKLATHWKISEDKKTFWFRINPNARWSDGKAVTTDDMIATMNLYTDDGIMAPYTNELYAKYHLEKISKYILKVSLDEVNWRMFYYFSGTSIFPAHHLNKIDGAGYLKKYQFKMLPGTGPYVLDEKNTSKGNHIVLKRRSDWWAKDEAFFIGKYNFDEIKIIVVRDEVLEKEKFKKGEIDYYDIAKPSVWVKEFSQEDPNPPFDALKRGLVQKRKVYNYHPEGVRGIVFNMRKAPFDDLKVRKAFAYLWNRKQLIEKLFYNEYALLNSTYPNSVYQNYDNPIFEYNPEMGNKLLDEAGWDKKNAEGIRINKNGEPFQVTMTLHQIHVQWFTPFQEDLKKAGVILDIKVADGNTLFQMGLERRFQLKHQAWTALFYPNPESSFHSNSAKKDNTTNFSGISDPRIDKICDEYNTMFDKQVRIDAIKEVDKILAESVHYALAWYRPYSVRAAYWNKFGMPESVVGYVGNWKEVTKLWWIEPELEKQLELAKKDQSIKMPIGDVIVDYFGKLKNK